MRNEDLQTADIQPMSREAAATHPRNRTPSAMELKAGMLASRVMDPPVRNLMAGAAMTDPTQSPEAAAWCAAILYKLLPGGLGAAVMICVDPPQSKRELFARLFVAFVVSYFLGDVMFDALRSFAWLAFLDPHKRAHTVGVDFIVGGAGWFVVGAAAMLLKRFKADPLAVVDDAKKVL